MYLRLVFILSLLFSSLSGSLFAQNILFETIGLNQGLSQQSVLAIHQDHLNRMWFGTRNGLNMWDGVRMKQFYPVHGDETSLMEHKVVQIIQQGKHLWVQTNNGVSSLDLETLSFKRYAMPGIMDIGLFNDTVLVGTKTGLQIFDKGKDSFLNYANPDIENKPVSVVYQDKNQSLWLAIENNNQVVYVSNGKTEIINIPVYEPLIILDLLLTSRNKMFIATRYHGVIVYDLNTKQFDYINKTSYPFFLKDLSVRSIKEDEEGKIWAGTMLGLAIFDLNIQSASFIQVSDKSEYSLSHNSIHCLYLSNDNYIWVGTYFGGLNYGKVSNDIFKKYNDTEGGPSYQVIGPIIEDARKNIWIGTEGGGLDYFNRTLGTFKNYPRKNSSSGLSQSNVKSLLITRNNHLLIGTYQGGLNILNIENDKITQYDNPTIKNAPKHVNAIISYGDDYLLATEKGVVSFNLQSQKFTPFFNNAEQSLPEIHSVVTSLYLDNQGIIWIGLEFDGLLAYDPVSKKLRKYAYDEFNDTSIAYNSINIIMEDRMHRLWIGTDGGGLCLYNRAEDNFTTYNKAKNKLPSDFVYGMVESRFGNFWVSTSNGLSRFDFENNHFFNYECKAGFPLKELNYGALLLTREGELFVGGIDGLISFTEEALLFRKVNQKIIFSDLEVNNQSVDARDGTGILSYDISIADFFSLKPKHNVFKIFFSACNYNSILKNKYQYQLVGFDKEWVNAEYNSTATYTNLNPGKYRFRVRGTDVIYNPVTEEKSIDIYVKPPITRTWYAYTLYLLVIISLILLFNYFYLAKKRLADQVNYERDDKKRITELNLFKLKFFTDISQEFMNPLTIILSSIENILTNQKYPPHLKPSLNLAFRNAKRLKNLNRELVEFRMIEQGRLKLKIQEHDIVPYLNDIFDAFAEMAIEKDIDYSFQKNTNQLVVFYDPVQLDKVFFNLLFNAFNRAAETSGKVTLQLKDKTNVIKISVIDNGIIPSEETKESFNQLLVENTNMDKKLLGGSIGLALSQSIIHAHKGQMSHKNDPEKGNILTVTLLKGNTHFDPALIINEKSSNRFTIDKDLLSFESTDVETVLKSDELSVNSDAPLMLIVDDNPEMGLILKNLFGGSYRIEIASDGQQGLDKALVLMPDIIISEVKLPKISGFELCEKLKRNINTSHVLVLFLTAHDTEENRIAGLKYGADSYCTKPFSSDMLRTMVESLFKNRSILQEKFSKNLNLSSNNITHNSLDREFLKKFQNIVEENILNPNFSVDEFAKEMGLSRTLFYHKVKSITGQTPNNFIQTIRLNKAADMLLNDPTQNISDVAYQSGFNSPRYFSLCFKNHYGVKPSKYIQENHVTKE
jgi:ligand-binding sensor domain-containing protein/DNA-binding response OmpR family regulator/signal transduction histidine kinase